MKMSQRMVSVFFKSVLVGCVLSCIPNTANAHRKNHRYHHDHSRFLAPYDAKDVSVQVEDRYGSEFATYWDGKHMFVEGQWGVPYQIRVTNHSHERVEVVVSVDGRDVIRGDLANYRKHRGYVLEPYGSVVIEGFRQSLNEVAEFRFVDRHRSYSARRGSPQHVGVIGVAVFKERRKKVAKRPKPLVRHRRYSPYTNRGGETLENEEMVPMDRYSSKGSSSRAAKSSAVPSLEPRDQKSYERYSEEDSPASVHQLGTEYGASRYSSAREVSFKRRLGRPDSIMAVYYDSYDGLRAQGVIIDPAPYTTAPEPFPHRQFAPPPPP